jgi:hypothetical protein
MRAVSSLPRSFSGICGIYGGTPEDGLKSLTAEPESLRGSAPATDRSTPSQISAASLSFPAGTFRFSSFATTAVRGQTLRAAVATSAGRGSRVPLPPAEPCGSPIHHMSQASPSAPLVPRQSRGFGRMGIQSLHSFPFSVNRTAESPEYG